MATRSRCSWKKPSWSTRSILSTSAPAISSGPTFSRYRRTTGMPAIIDTVPADGGEAISVFESGAILLYLAEKTGRFLAKDTRGSKIAIERPFWQVGGLGPMAGQNHQF